MRYKCICQYNGKAYSGFQRQRNAITVQAAIETALRRVYNHDIVIHPASRTDKGVHALNQVFHYDSDIDIAVDKLALVINRQLADDIRIRHIEKVNDSFHARYDVTDKTYLYKFSTAKHYDVFSKDIIYQYGRPFDCEKAKQLANHFIGRHDYRAFMAAGSDKQKTVRTIHQLTFDCCDATLVMAINGDGFLYHMVRIIMGVLFDYNEANKTKGEILRHFNAGNRQFFKRTAPGCGLYLAQINYK